MTEIYFLGYTIIALIMAFVDFHFAVKAFRKGDKVGRAIGWSAGFAGIITLAYLASVHTHNLALVSLFSNLTFISIDCMLVSLAYYAFLVTGLNGVKGSRTVNDTIRTFAALDILVMVANIFTGVATTFQLESPVGVSYQMKTPYVIHLVFTYFIVVVTLIVLVHKSIHTPRKYRNQYLLIIAAIGVAVLINAVFLFQDKGSFFTKVDCSILGYSIGLYLMYWTAYDYKPNDMLNSLSKTVVENVNQGIVLFDYMNELIMYNRRAEALLQGVPLKESMPLDDFSASIGLPASEEERFSAQCDIEGCVPLRCDFRVLKDKRNRPIGRLFAFTDITRDIDLTTGFEYAKDYAYTDKNAARYPAPTTVIVFDIIGLREINRVQGRDRGDKMIRALAKRMRQTLPQTTTFLRGFEAYLIAICPGLDEAESAGRLEAVIGENRERWIYAMSATGQRTLTEALRTAYRSIQIKKLLCPGSLRSQSLASLVRALKEADADTEDHVRRTQKMGALLGRRIGLTDAQLVQLELLCLLHDIGKIGIPLEILNKPGKLADQEWEVLRTHPEKGYQIAMSADELSTIADMILYHHERWDGRGYPKGLKGEEIPVLSRIISIVDAYDAMVNDRSYRKALKPEKAQEEIRVNAGTQFDPVLAGEFLNLLAEHPEVARGEKVGPEAEESVVKALTADASATGVTVPIAYSRYMLDMNETIIEVDERFEEITGYDRADVIGKMTQFDLIPAEDRAHYVLQVGKQFSQGDMAYLRHEIRRKDGVRIQVACYGRRYYDSAVKAYRNEIIIFQL